MDAKITHQDITECEPQLTQAYVKLMENFLEKMDVSVSHEIHIGDVEVLAYNYAWPSCVKTHLIREIIHHYVDLKVNAAYI